ERVGTPRPIYAERPHVVTGSRSMILLDKIANKSVGNYDYLSDLFALHSGKQTEEEWNLDHMKVFDTLDLRSLLCSQLHLVLDQQFLIIRASRPIAANEELTISYIAPNQLYAKRKAALAAYGFECTCLLCKADASLNATEFDARRILDELPVRLPTSSQLDLTAIAKRTHVALRTYLPYAYPARSFKLQGLPGPVLAAPLLALAHTTLGPDIPSWRHASVQSRKKAKTYLHACMYICMQMNVAYSRSTSHCRVFSWPCGQSRYVGVLALMALAELAFLSSNPKEKARCASLKACAKGQYVVCYGEEESFDDKHQEYACKAVTPAVGIQPGDEEWTQCSNEAVQKGDEMWEFWKKME
ncbi:hypothetical protein LTR95_008779, partial [Oleoguttula sp. CCFEE 5521]